jgi:hypothetical protein
VSDSIKESSEIYARSSESKRATHLMQEKGAWRVMVARAQISSDKGSV